jgi:hypothetical protein
MKPGRCPSARSWPAALALLRREQVALLYAIQDDLFPEVDLADLAESRWILQEIRAGRMKTTPAGEVLAELDHIAEWGWDADGAWIVEIGRRIAKFKSGTAKTRTAEEVLASMRARRYALAQRGRDGANE